MKIKDYAMVYYNQPEEERDINEWYPVLDAFIGNYCMKFQNIYTQEDRVQVAWIGAIKAIKSFDITKGIQFTTYLARCMHNELLMYNRKGTRKNQPIFVSLSEPLVEDASLTIEDIVADDSYLDYDEMIIKNKWNHFLENYCNPQERKILKRRMEDKTQLEISDEFGYTGQSYISRVLRKSNKKFKSMVY